MINIISDRCLRMLLGTGNISTGFINNMNSFLTSPHSQSQPRSSTLMVMEPVQDLGIILIKREKIGGYI